MKPIIKNCFLAAIIILFNLIDAFSGEVIFVGGGGNVHVNDEYVTAQLFQDDLKNVNAVLKKYNELYDDLPYPIITLSKKVEAGDYGANIDNEVYKDNKTNDENEIIAGRLYFTPGTDYVSLKWDADNGGFGLWYVANVAYLDFPVHTDFTVLSHGLSHYSEWDTNGDNPPGSNVPEPVTMLLFGFGLIGIAGISRKNK